MDSTREKFQTEIRNFVVRVYKNDLISTIFVVVVFEVALLFSGFTKGWMLASTMFNLAICFWAIRCFRIQAIRKYRRLSKFTDENWKPKHPDEHYGSNPG